jgi:hypothetical protein
MGRRAFVCAPSTGAILEGARTIGLPQFDFCRQARRDGKKSKLLGPSARGRFETVFGGKSNALIDGPLRAGRHPRGASFQAPFAILREGLRGCRIPSDSDQSISWIGTTGGAA